MKERDNRIFVSYRRTDSASAAGRLTDALGQRFGQSSVFMDLDAIEPGVDFIEFINQVVASASVMLVVIGPMWLDASSADGRRRLDNPDDFVRIEIESALRSGLSVIPILVDGASIPTPNELPASLSPLLRLNAFQLRHESFQNDVERLSVSLSRILRKTPHDVSNTHSEKAVSSQINEGVNSILTWVVQKIEGSQSHRRTAKIDDTISQDDNILQQFRDIIREARNANIQLNQLMACLEEISSEVLNKDPTADALEEHLRAFPVGKTLPLINARLEILFWERAMNSQRPGAFVEYLVRFPHGTYVERAHGMRDQLIKDMGGFDPSVPRVFLNYRRVDSQDTADRIYSVLTQAIPAQNITMDIDKKSIVPGFSIEVQLQRLVDECDVMFAIINNRWFEEINRRAVQHENGGQIDFVRAELKHALARGNAMPVIPILGEAVEHPQASELPEDIRDLSRRSSIRLSREKFSEDVLTVFRQISKHFNKS